MKNSVRGWNNPGSSWNCLRHFIINFRINTQKLSLTVTFWRRRWRIQGSRSSYNEASAGNTHWMICCLLALVLLPLSPPQQPQLFHSSITFMPREWQIYPGLRESNLHWPYNSYTMTQGTCKGFPCFTKTWEMYLFSKGRRISHAI